MAARLKLGTNLCPFMKLSDRFVTSGYTRSLPLEKALRAVARIKGIHGAAYGWPCRFKKPRDLRKLFDDCGVTLCTLDTDIYTDARFRQGSLSNRDRKVRGLAVARGKAAMDAAAEAGVPDINFWLGHDGFEYPFQGHYVDAWKWIAEGLGEIAEHNPDVPIGVEPKCKEPRANQYLANTGKALMLVNQVNRPNLGITLDFGHSLAAMESPAEAAVLAMSQRRLQQVHLNDNYRDWDHDLVPGAVNVWDHVEFFYWLRKLDYRGWCCVDIYPYRDEGPQVLQRASQVVHRCWDIAGRLIDSNVEKDIRAGRHLEILRRLWDMIG